MSCSRNLLLTHLLGSMEAICGLSDVRFRSRYFLAAGLFIGCWVPRLQAADEGLIRDAALLAAIREQLPVDLRAQPTLGPTELARLSVLNASGLGITQLSGLEHCIHLRELSLARNAIEDLTPLRGIKHLQLLDISHNQVQDLAAVAELRKLQYLQADHNLVENLAPLAGLETLNSLYLEHNKIQDVAPLAGLKNLWSLYLDHNQIVNLAPLAELKRLETLGLAHNAIEDIRPLAHLRLRHFLFLQHNQIKDVTPLLELSASQERDDPAATWPFLRIYLGGNPLSDEAVSSQVPLLRERGFREVDLKPDPEAKEKAS